jgi:hypothetical protein
MTNPIIAEIEAAAAPSLIAVLQALQQFDAAMGNDPLQWPVKYPGAKLILAGTVMSQLPTLAQAEGGVVTSSLNSVYAGWITKLQSIGATATKPA